MVWSALVAYNPGRPAVQPLCLVLMPFGRKKDPGRPDQTPIDFNAIYETGIKPGIQDADMAPIRADEEQTLGIIHKPMFERLLLSDFAIAELTVPNPYTFASPHAIAREGGCWRGGADPGRDGMAPEV